jgi:hypothetical protein
MADNHLQILGMRLYLDLSLAAQIDRVLRGEQAFA